MLKAIVIDNGIGAADAFLSTDDWQMERATTGPDFAPNLAAYDLLIVPNGADHVALLRMRSDIRQFLDAGNALFCFCGWFTDWIPGHRWVHDNSHPTREVRHLVRHDPHKLLEGVELAPLDRNRHGISGWWACGSIETTAQECVLIEDTWGRPIVVADDRTTPGLMFLTASGPLGDYVYGADSAPLRRLYHNALSFAASRARARERQRASIGG